MDKIGKKIMANTNQTGSGTRPLVVFLTLVIAALIISLCLMLRGKKAESHMPQITPTEIKVTLPETEPERISEPQLAVVETISEPLITALDVETNNNTTLTIDVELKMAKESGVR
ncbi:MAG: hypothetical protein M3Q80_02230 [bacterium]|nr:hypothetical protein [bacterium]